MLTCETDPSRSPRLELREVPINSEADAVTLAALASRTLACMYKVVLIKLQKIFAPDNSVAMASHTWSFLLSITASVTVISKLTISQRKNLS